MKKLKEKKLIDYEKYGKISLTAKGLKAGVEVLRKHRLWETFLVQRLGFGWDEVHEVAEELEHVSSAKLIERLDAYLEHPDFDPHGDPIPDRNGKLPERSTRALVDCAVGEKVPPRTPRVIATA